MKKAKAIRGLDAIDNELSKLNRKSIEARKFQVEIYELRRKLKELETKNKYLSSKVKQLASDLKSSRQRFNALLASRRQAEQKSPTFKELFYSGKAND